MQFSEVDKPTRKKQWLSYCFTVAVFILFALLLYFNRQQYQQLLRLRPLPILTVLLITLLPDRAFVNYWLFRALKAPVSFWESYGLTVIGTVANQLPVAGGIMAKALYLKRKYQLSYTTYISGTAALYLLAAAGGGAIGLAGLGYAILISGKEMALLLVGGFLLMTASPLLIYYIPLKDHSSSWLNALVGRLTEAAAILSENPGLMFKLISLSAVGVVLLAIRLWAAFQLLSTSVPFEYCLVFSAATLLTQLVSFAPGGLGIREGIVASLGLLANVEPTVSVLAVGIERLLSVGISALVAVAFSFTLGQSLIQPAVAIEPQE